SVNRGEPSIFTNYNGGVPAGKNYERLDPVDDPFVWQVARATAAAPAYFSTSTFTGLGSFQDGGIRGHNNPINLAMLEAKRIWRTTQTPDVVVSLGTGYEASDAKASRFRNFLLDGFAPRSFRSWMESIVGKNTWDDFESRVPEGSRGNYFRFDSSLPAPLPAMDDTDCMDQLSRWVRTSQDWDGYSANQSIRPDNTAVWAQSTVASRQGHSSVN
ncbi:acyl transferase/acyl hydrolase/lysophospholipase, partial [Aspergillus insuetus]